MAETHWFETQLREARAEVESWSAWKRDAMRQEVIRTGSTNRAGSDAAQPASPVQGKSRRP